MDTPAQTISNVQGRLEDPEFRFYSLADYVRSYNDALDEISERTEVRESSVFVKRRKWSVYTDLRGVLPPNALRITSVFNPLSQKWLDPTTAREMDNTVGRKWEANAGTSRWWFMRGLWHLGTYPICPDDTSPLRIHFVSMLDHIKADGGTVTGLTSKPADLPDDFSLAIETFMMYDLLCERKEVKKGMEYFGRFEEMVPMLRNLAENRMRRDRTPRIGARR